MKRLLQVLFLLVSLNFYNFVQSMDLSGALNQIADDEEQNQPSCSSAVAAAQQAAQSQINSLQGQLSSETSKASSLQTQISSMQQEVSAEEARATAAENALSISKSKVATLQNQLISSQQELVQVKNSLANLSKGASNDAELTKQIKDLNKQLSDAQNKVSALETQLKAANQELQSNKVAYATALSDLNTKLSFAENQIESVKNSAVQQISAANSKATAANMQVAELQNKLSAANAEISKLIGGESIKPTPEPEKPSKPVQPTPSPQPTPTPTQPEKPVAPVTPAQPAQPVQPAPQPVQPTQPVTQPTAPTDSSASTGSLFNTAELEYLVTTLTAELSDNAVKNEISGEGCPSGQAVEKVVDFAQDFQKLIEYNKNLLLEEQNLRACLGKNNNDSSKCPVAIKSIDYANSVADTQSSMMIQLGSLLQSLTGSSNIPIPAEISLDVEIVNTIGQGLIDSNIKFVENWSREAMSNGIKVVGNKLIDSLNKDCKIPPVIIEHVKSLIDLVALKISAASTALLGILSKYIWIKIVNPETPELFDDIDLGDGLSFGENGRIAISIEDVKKAYDNKIESLKTEIDDLNDKIESLNKKSSLNEEERNVLKQFKLDLKNATKLRNSIEARYKKYNRRSDPKKESYISARKSELRNLRDYLKDNNITNLDSFNDSIDKGISKLTKEIPDVFTSGNIKEAIKLWKERSSLKNLGESFKSLGEGMQKALVESVKTGTITITSEQPTLEPISSEPVQPEEPVVPEPAPQPAKEPTVKPGRKISDISSAEKIEIRRALIKRVEEIMNDYAKGNNILDLSDDLDIKYIKIVSSEAPSVEEVIRITYTTDGWLVDRVNANQIPKNTRIITQTVETGVEISAPEPVVSGGLSSLSPEATTSLSALAQKMGNKMDSNQVVKTIRNMVSELGPNPTYEQIQEAYNSSPFAETGDTFNIQNWNDFANQVNSLSDEDLSGLGIDNTLPTLEEAPEPIVPGE